MEQKLKCEIVKDLLPNYIEKMTSEATNYDIEEHLKSCEDCNRYYMQMKGDIAIEQAPEVTEFKNYLKKTKFRYIMLGLLFSAGFLGIIISAIVNIAVDGCLSWSLIVTAGCIMAYVFLGLLIGAKKHRFIKAVGSLSILVIPFLALTEIVVNTYFLKTPVYWMRSLGIPITLLWLMLTWITICVSVFLKLNIFFILAIISFMSGFGGFITNVIAGGYNSSFSDIVGNLLSITISAIIMVIMIVLGIGLQKIKNTK